MLTSRLPSLLLIMFLTLGCVVPTDQWDAYEIWIESHGGVDVVLQLSAQVDPNTIVATYKVPADGLLRRSYSQSMTRVPSGKPHGVVIVLDSMCKELARFVVESGAHLVMVSRDATVSIAPYSPDPSPSAEPAYLESISQCSPTATE